MGRFSRDELAAWRRRRALADDRRVGLFSRSQARARQLAFVRQHWWRLLMMPAFTSLLALGALLLPAPLSGFVMGVVASAGWWLAGMIVLLATGTASLHMGDTGEQLSADELRRLRRRGWELVNHLTLKGVADIDHLAVGPGGLLVVETKWRSTEWDLTDPEHVITREAVRQARENADRAAVWLRPEVGRIPPHAAVFAWGPQVTSAADEGPLVIDGVHVMRGVDARSWLAGLPTDTLGREAVQAAWSKVDQHAARRDGYDLAKDGPPPKRVGEIIDRWLIQLVAGFAAAGIGAMVTTIIGGLVGFLVACVLIVGAALAARRLAAPAWLVAAWTVGSTAFIALIVGLVVVATFGN